MTGQQAANVILPKMGDSATTLPPDFVYVYRWNRIGRKGQRCRIVSGGGAMAPCILEFADGQQIASSRNAVVLAGDSQNTSPRPKAARRK